LKEISEDLTTSHLVHIAHGCNAQGKMGSGVAKAVRAKWPKAYSAYVTYIEEHGADYALGKDFWIHVDNDTMIIHNLITQRFYGRDGSKFARYIDVVHSLEDMVKTFWKTKQFAISRLGCSLGGLQWSIVKELMLELEERHGVEFWVYHIEVDPDA